MALVALSLGLSIAARAQILVNGSFESDIVGAGSPTTPQTPPGWTGSVSSVDPDQPGLIAPSNYGAPDPEDGNIYIQLDDTVVLSQQFTATASGTYTLSWYDSWQIPVGSSYLGEIPFITFIDGTEEPGYSVSLGGSTFNFAPLTTVTTTAWTHQSLQVDLSAGTTYTLAFQGPPVEHGNSWDLYNDPLLDNISLQGPSASVPDNGSAGILVVGACAVLLVARRRVAVQS